MAVWDTTTWKEVPGRRHKPLLKGPVTSLAYSGRAGAASGVGPCLLFASDERPAVWGM